ncbi:MAG: glycosyltransferase family 9 protein [Gammaproteobacteria bacterium]
MLVTGDRIGDALLKWPLISGLKRTAPNVHLSWIAGCRTSVFCGPLKQLVQGVINETVEQAGIGNSWLELWRPEPRFNADIVISTEPKMRNAILARRIPHQRFISPAANFLLSDARPSKTGLVKDSVQDRLQQLFELAIESPIVPYHVVPIEKELSDKALQILPANETYVGFSPGAGGQSKRWPLQRFIEIARVQSGQGRRPVFFLGPEEAHLLAELKAELPSARFPEYDELHRRRGGVMLSIALASRMSCSVANDSGGGHILAAGAQPLISLYGHTSATKFRPKYGPHTAIIASDFGAKAIDAIPVQIVLDTFNRILDT